MRATRVDDVLAALRGAFEKNGWHGPTVMGSVRGVTPGEGETCESILEYLNTAGTVGKTYCGGSSLRGGWKLADCGGR